MMSGVAMKQRPPSLTTSSFTNGWPGCASMLHISLEGGLRPSAARVSLRQCAAEELAQMPAEASHERPQSADAR